MTKSDKIGVGGIQKLHFNRATVEFDFGQI